MEKRLKTILLLLFSSFMSVGWGQDCDEGYVPDCSGDGDCCSEDWIGDGYCDNEDQSWGCDLICYEEELSDCGHFPQLYYHPNELSEQLEQNNSSTIIFTPTFASTALIILKTITKAKEIDL